MRNLSTDFPRKPVFQYPSTVITFLVLLPLEADEKIQALKHYYGITHHEDELVVRGIEVRRHDNPNFIKQFQTQLLYTLLDYKDSGEVVTKGYEDVLFLLTNAMD